MDDIAKDFQVSPPALARSARGAWNAYRTECGPTAQVSDLITNLLHLADVDGHALSGAASLRRAATDYEAEIPNHGLTCVHCGSAAITPTARQWATCRDCGQGMETGAAMKCDDWCEECLSTATTL
ncbi:hypothetical protein ACIOHE_26470 [Streptomyces sp. NPDC087851]|uniref:hypothetical protein n=1 Tax=Streptomyces sp. NPDC087851 TaxID=3365810 RepID=UPI003807F5F1